MPTYLYECPTHGEFEEEHSIKITLQDCPRCQAEGVVPQKLKPLIRGGSGKGIVELYGQDLVDKCKADAQKFEKEVYSKESTYANLIGESHYEAFANSNR